MMFNIAIIAALLVVGFTIGVLFGVVLSFWLAEWVGRSREKPTCNQPPLEPLPPMNPNRRNMWGSF